MRVLTQSGRVGSVRCSLSHPGRGILRMQHIDMREAVGDGTVEYN